MHPLIVNQNAPATTLTELIRQEADNINSGTKTIHDVGAELLLSPPMIDFVLLYIKNRDVPARAKVSAAMAYDYDLTTKQGQNNAASTAARLLKHPQCKVLFRILLDNDGLNDTAVDQRLQELIEDRNDGKTSILAIQEYNKITQRSTKTTVEHISTTKYDTAALSIEQLEALIQLVKLMKVDAPHSRDITPDITTDTKGISST